MVIRKIHLGIMLVVFYLAVSLIPAQSVYASGGGSAAAGDTVTCVTAGCPHALPD